MPSTATRPEEEGLRLATQRGYDAVVLDILLPGMNGYKMCALSGC